MVRQRRAWFNDLRGRGLKVPNRDVIKEYKHHAKGLEDAEFVDTIATEILPDFQRRQKLYRQAQLEAGMPDNCDQRVLGPTGKDNTQESWIYSNSQKNCFVLIHVDLIECIERKSMTFASLDTLMLEWEGGAIRWRENRKI